MVESVGGHRISWSTYLYSPYQLIALAENDSMLLIAAPRGRPGT